MNTVLDKALENKDISAVVVTGEGRFFCNGMDLKWIDANMNKADKLQAEAEKLLGRILCFPVPTLAAINGHFCAAGCMLGLAFDYRIMSSDRGLCFVPAIDLGLVYSLGMTKLMKAKCPPHMHNDLIIYGARYDAAKLVTERVVHKTVPADQVLSETVGIALDLTKSGRFSGEKYRSTMCRIKRNTYQEAYQSLVDSLHFQGMGFLEGSWDNQGRSRI